MIEAGLVTYLSEYAPLTALIGTRLYPDRLPQSPTLPAVVYFSVSDPGSYSHDGETDWREEIFQFDCWGVTPLEAISVKNALRGALSGYKGMMGSVTVEAAFVQGGRTMDDDETGLFRRILEVVFQYKE